MPPLKDLQEKYTREFITDFRLEYASPEVQVRMLAMVSERLMDVAVVRCIAMMDTAQQVRFSAALTDPQKNEAAIVSLAAEIPGLQAAIEEAFLTEYQVLKESFVV